MTVPKCFGVFGLGFCESAQVTPVSALPAPHLAGEALRFRLAGVFALGCPASEQQTELGLDSRVCDGKAGAFSAQEASSLG